MHNKNSGLYGSDSANAIRHRVLHGLAGNRAPGFHFPGYFMGCHWPRLGPEVIEEGITSGPHCLNARGELDVTTLFMLIDTALATAPRLQIELGARQATVQLHAQFTGADIGVSPVMQTKLEGFTEGAGVRQSIVRGTLLAAGRAAAYATASFIVLPPPPGVKLAPLPWQQDTAGTSELPESELDARERHVMDDCNRALKKADQAHAFIERFWGVLPRKTKTGASCRIPIRPQLGNRVGHVQGGILVGIAAATAIKAAPRHPHLSNISAWFVSPGQGHALRVRSAVSHAGRSFCVIKTDITGDDGRLVLTTTSTHAASQHAPHGGL